MKIKFIFLAILFTSCGLTVGRPTQEMANSAAALRAAKEVQADVLSPELYRQAYDFFDEAKKEYRFKNFSVAKEKAETAMHFAEQAELDALKKGAARSSVEDEF